MMYAVINGSQQHKLPLASSSELLRKEPSGSIVRTFYVQISNVAKDIGDLSSLYSMEPISKIEIMDEDTVVFTTTKYTAVDQISKNISDVANGSTNLSVSFKEV